MNQRFCQVCNTPIGKYRKYCDLHRQARHASDNSPWDYSHVKLQRYRNKQKFVDYLGGKCSVCGYDKCNQALQFHHLDPTQKDFSISANTNKAWSKVQSELDKCILLCANCHSEVHAGLIQL